jgi:hypothetical protein
MQCKGKGTANHHKTELKPQVFPVRNVLTRAQETNWTVNSTFFLLNICVLFCLVLVPNGIGSAILSLLRPIEPLKKCHKPWFQQKDQTGWFQSPALGITVQNLHHTNHLIIILYKLPKFYNGPCVGALKWSYHSRIPLA